MRMIDLIAKKRDGSRHSPEEIRFIVQGAASGELPDEGTLSWWNFGPTRTAKLARR